MYLISSKYKFIFVHIYKNAGTSISNALIPLLLPASLNKTIDTFGQPFSPKILSHVKFRLYRKFIFNSNFLPTHATALDILNKIGFTDYSKYRTMAVVRNPYAWQWSIYTFILKNKHHKNHNLVKTFDSFTEYIEWVCKKENFQSQKSFVVDSSGRQIVENLLSFETLANDFVLFRETANLPKAVKLQHFNTTNSKKALTNHKNKKAFEIIKDAYAEDFEFFKYSTNDNPLT